MSDRQNFIGPSEFAAVLGVSPWQTPLGLALVKTGQLESFAGSPATKWGTALEDIIRREFAIETGLPVKRCNRTLVHPQHDFIRGHLDGIAGVNPRRAVFEAKTANAFAGGEWLDGIPEYYVTQVQAYMGLSNLGEAYVAVLIGGQDFRIFHTQFDPELYELMIREVAEYWANLKAGILPAPVAKDAKLLGKLYKVDPGKVIELDDTWAATLQARQQLKGEIAKLEEHLEGIDAEIKRTMQNAEVAVCEGQYKVSWKEVKSRRLDTLKLIQQHPDLCEQYSTVTTSRRFEIRSLKNGGVK